MGCPGSIVLRPRRFPPPWTVEQIAPCFIVRDHNGQALAFVYCEDKAAGWNSVTHDTTRLSGRVELEDFYQV